MSEFHDFLKYQFAYVAIGEFKEGKFSDAEKLFEKAVSTFTQGFKRAYLLQEPGTDKGIAIIIWDSKEDMEANKSEMYDAILKEMNPLFLKAPVINCYEILNEIRPKIGVE